MGRDRPQPPGLRTRNMGGGGSGAATGRGRHREEARTERGRAPPRFREVNLVRGPLLRPLEGRAYH